MAAKIRIISDGTSCGTTITADGVVLPVSKFTISGDADKQIVTAVIELFVDEIDVIAEEEKS